MSPTDSVVRRTSLQARSGQVPLTSSIAELRGLTGKPPPEGKSVTTTGTVVYAGEKSFRIFDAQGKVPAAILVTAPQYPSISLDDEVQVSGVVEVNEKDGRKVALLKAQPGQIVVKHKGNSEFKPVPFGDGGVPINASTLDAYEGVPIEVKDCLVVGASNSLPKGDFYVIVDEDKAPRAGRTAPGGILRGVAGAAIPFSVRAPTEGLSALNTGTPIKKLEGYIAYRFGRPQLQIARIDPNDITPSTLTPEVSTLPQKLDRARTLFLGSSNLENKDIRVEDVSRVFKRDPRNVDDDLGDGKYVAAAKYIAQNLGGPDIQALQEMQDNDGGEISEEVSASENFKRLIEEIVKAGGPRYEYIDLPPVNGKEGGMPGGNIRNGFLYNPERVTLVPGSAHRLEDPAFAGSRAPVIATFEFTHGGKTERVTAMSVHLKSKAGGSEASEGMRIAQAKVIHRWATENKPKNDNEHVSVNGDFNSYTGEAPIAAATAGGVLRDLGETLDPTDRYTSQFGGVVGDLDHSMVSTRAEVVYDIVHTNSDFDDRFRPSDHDFELEAIVFNS